MVISFRSFLKPFASVLVFTICLSGFLFSWLDRDTGIKVESHVVHLSEKQAQWSQFIGYGPEKFAAQLSAFSEEDALIIAQQARRLLGINEKNGQISWSQELSRYALTNTASVIGKKILVATNEPRLLALHAKTGTMIWSTDLPNMVTAQVAADETQVFVKTIANDFMALNAKNGKILWQYQHKSPSTSVLLKNSSAPKLTNDKAIVGFSDGKLVAFHRKSGEIIWEHQFTSRDNEEDFNKFIDIASDPIIDEKNGLVYANAYHDQLKCLSLATGEVQWEQPISSHAKLMLGQYLYLLEDKNVLYALDRLDGTKIWTKTDFALHKVVNKEYSLTSPSLTDATQYIVLADNEGNVYWLSTEDGNIIAKASLNIFSPILNSPLVDSSKTYVINQHSRLVAWAHPKPKTAANPITTAEIETTIDDQPVLAPETTEKDSLTELES